MMYGKKIRILKNKLPHLNYVSELSFILMISISLILANVMLCNIKGRYNPHPKNKSLQEDGLHHPLWKENTQGVQTLQFLT